VTFGVAPVLSGASITSATIPVASVVGTAAAISGANAFTGTNTFNTNLPTSSLTPTTSTQLTTKTYVDSGILNESAYKYVVGAGRTYTTIQSAITAAQTAGYGAGNPITIFITEGTYTENITLTTEGISLLGATTAFIAYSEPPTQGIPAVTIVGNAQITATGTSYTYTSFQNIQFISNNSTTAFTNHSVPGTFPNSYFFCNFINCKLANLSTGGSYLGNTYNGSAGYGFTVFKDCSISANNSSIVALSLGDVEISIYNTYIYGSVNSTYGSAYFYDSQIGSGTVTISSGGSVYLSNCSLPGGSNSISISSGGNGYLYFCQFGTSAANTVSGSGALELGPVTFQGGGHTSTYGSSLTITSDQISQGPTCILAATTTVNASTSGTVAYSQSFQGATYKKVIAYCAAAVGTASYTFPVAFTNTPVVVSTNGLATTIVTSLSTSAMTITGATSTGYIIVEGY
jgi:hypothetical protein